jgi:hypothetical protein
MLIDKTKARTMLRAVIDCIFCSVVFSVFFYEVRCCWRWRLSSQKTSKSSKGRKASKRRGILPTVGDVWGDTGGQVLNDTGLSSQKLSKGYEGSQNLHKGHKNGKGGVCVCAVIEGKKNKKASSSKTK